MNIRAQSVAKAKKIGICTQCLKLKALKHHYQCQRCIDTNRKKRRDKEMKADRENNCKRCGKKPRFEGKMLCADCGEKAREAWRRKYAKTKALKNARKEAFASKDTGIGKRTYKKRMPIASLQMAGMVNDLERFIGNLKMMSATDYLEAREELIKSIIRRGGNNGNS